MNIESSSVVSQVVVHARGALVTREVALPQDLPPGVVDVDVIGVTIEAQAGSARATLEDSERVVAAVHSAIVFPKGDVRPGPTLEKVRELDAKLARLNHEIEVLGDRRNQLTDITIEPYIRFHDRSKRERDPLDERFTDALEMASLVSEKVFVLDERLVALDKERRALARVLEAARLEDLQTSTGERSGEARPRRTITTRLVGEGRPGKLLVTYAIAAARWWPTYTLRMEDNGARATWTFEALVAQASGEDWSAVRLALSSADLLFDAQLPELRSLRFGRAQAPKRRAFRPPPVGVDEMFGGYRAFGGRAFEPPPAHPTSAQPPSPMPTRSPIPRPASFARSMEMPLAMAEAEQAREDLDEDTIVTGVMRAEFAANAPDFQELKKKLAPDAAPAGPAAPAAPAAPARHHAPAPAAAPMGMASAPAPMARTMAMAMAMPLQPQSAPPTKGGFFGGIGTAIGGGGRMRKSEPMRGGAPIDDFLSSGEDGAGFEPEEPEPELSGGGVWTNHDMLILAHADAPRPGRLIPQPAGDSASAASRAVHEVDAAADARYRDPLESRGMFDHRYDAAGRADVPSDGRVHRMTVAQAPCGVRIAWRAVPSETEEVFREAHVTNPFETGLLGGPVDVYLDGSLLAATMIDRIDRGGALFCGMGVDDRIKVARNVRVSEESAGLLGGSLAVTHAVDIELSSTIRDPVRVTVLERVPVTDDKALEVKLVKSSPPSDAYDQADRGAPVRGGHRFDVTVEAGRKTPIALVYRLVFAGKLDIVGGSRRG